MKIYMVKPEKIDAMLTASKAVAEFCKEFYEVRNIKCEIAEYEVKTQGKNYNDIAKPIKKK